MTPFIESMPEDWIMQIIAAQGQALQFSTQAKQTDKERILNKSILYAGYLLQKAGILSLEDQVALSEQYLGPELAPLAGVINQCLSTLYITLDKVYEDEKEAKGLISDVMKVKTTVQ